jgi:hypothetical protein
MTNTKGNEISFQFDCLSGVHPPFWDVEICIFPENSLVVIKRVVPTFGIAQSRYQTGFGEFTD